MTSHDNDFDPLEDLRGLDPAREVQPSEGFEASVIDAAHADVVVDLADERARRTRRGQTWLAAGAAAILFGFGGYSLGATPGHGGSDTAKIAVAQPSRATTADSMVAGWGWGHYQFSSSGLDAQGTQTPVFRFQADPIDDARAAAIAGTFGITDPLTQSDYGWDLTGDKVSSVSFGISTDQYSSVYYYNPDASPQTRCYQVVNDQAASGQQSGDGSQPDAGFGEEQQRQVEQCLQEAMASAPSGQEASTRLTQLLTDLGLSPADYQISGQDQTEMYADGAAATAELLVAGHPSDLTFNLTLSADGIASFNGMLGSTVSLGDYPVIGAQEAFDRLSDSRFGPANNGMVYAARADGGAAADTAGKATTLQEMTGQEMAAQPGLVSTEQMSTEQMSIEQAQSGVAPEGEPPLIMPQSNNEPQSAQQSSGPAAGDHPLISWPVQQVHITGAEVVYSLQWNADGTTLLVPYYRLTDTDGNTWSMIALADEALDFTPAG